MDHKGSVKVSILGQGWKRIEITLKTSNENLNLDRSVPGLKARDAKKSLIRFFLKKTVFMKIFFKELIFKKQSSRRWGKIRFW